MASEEHLRLSNTIKSVHETLRNDSKLLGWQEAWKKHCSSTDQLTEYSKAMQELAVNHWTKNTEQSSRIYWIHNYCQNYFFNFIFRYRDKEMKFLQDENVKNFTNIEVSNKLRLLDVGSCYNPFKQFDLFETLAVDLAPANSEVLKCDFLDVRIGSDTIISNSSAVQLKRQYYHVVVFCLLLEYLPSPEQRLKCCEKAYDLLDHEGLLIIVTPDSKHVGANAKLMKSWQYVLAKIGFVRVCYEKLEHLHCMAFRRALSRAVLERWTLLFSEKVVYKEIFIPQDFNSTTFKEEEDNNEGDDSFDEDDLKACFNELPDF